MSPRLTAAEQKTLQRIKVLRQKIATWNKEYYVDNQPTVSDQVYDASFAELKQLENKYASLVNADSPTQSVGYFAANSLFAKVQHEHKMLSINNAFSFADVNKFSAKVERITKRQNSYMISPKIDGLSLSLVFKNHRFVYGATRGNGVIGENITPNIMAMSGLQKLLVARAPIANFELRGEAFISKKNFFEINRQISVHRVQNLTDFVDQLTKKCRVKARLMNLKWEKLTSSRSPAAIAFVAPLTKWKSLAIEAKERCQLPFSLVATNQETLRTFSDWLAKETKADLPELIPKNKEWSTTLNIPFRFDQTCHMNPRNLTAGTLRQLNSQSVTDRNIEAVFYDIFVPQQNLLTMKAKMAMIEKIGFPTPELTFYVPAGKIENHVQKILHLRESLPYETDGAVVKVNEVKDHDSLGRTDRFRHNAIAYKFPASQTQTRILDIFPTVGRTGKITYNAALEIALLAGSRVGAATLHNPDFIRKLDLRIGDTVTIQKAGDIIPQILNVVLSKRSAQSVAWTPATECPSCQSKLVQPPELAYQFCQNSSCSEQKIQALIYFASQSGLNIQGLSEAKIRFLFHHQFVRTPFDFFQLFHSRSRILAVAKQDKLNIFGPKSISNLLNEIQKSRDFEWSQLLASLNILHVGERTAQIVANVFTNPDQLHLATLEQLKEIASIGPIVAHSIFNFFQNQAQYQSVKNLYNVKSSKNAQTSSILFKNEQSFWFGKVVVLTGTMDRPRRLVVNQLTKLGAQVRTTFSKNVDVCIAGESPGSKIAIASAQNIPVVRLFTIEDIINYEKK